MTEVLPKDDTTPSSNPSEQASKGLTPKTLSADADKLNKFAQQVVDALNESVREAKKKSM